MGESGDTAIVVSYPSTYIMSLGEPVGCPLTEISNISVPATFKNSVINSLNRWVPDKNGSYFTLEAFQESIHLWENVPIVFAQKHPDPILFAQNSEAALKEVNGVLAGYMTNARIVIEGHPRLLGSLTITNADAVQLWNEGKLSLSSAFFAYRDSERRIKKIESVNHILIFEETETSMPRDNSVIIQNLSKGAFVPNNPPNYGKAAEDAEWSAPTLSDFTPKKWDELSDSEKRHIASHYAYCGGLDSFSNLKLPHHNPNGDVVWHGVANAMARLNQTEVDGLRDKVEAHLKAHYKDFNKSVEANTEEIVDNMMPSKLDELKNAINELKNIIVNSVTKNALIAPSQVPESSIKEKLDVENLLETKKTLDSHPNSHVGDNMTEVELNKAIEAKDAIIASLNKEVEAEKAKTVELNKQLAEKDRIIESYRQKEKDAKFAAFLNTLKPGVYDTDEKKAELRNQFETSPQDLIVKLATEGKFLVKVEENKTGKEHVAEETTETYGGLNWNAITKKWE